MNLLRRTAAIVALGAGTGWSSTAWAQAGEATRASQQEVAAAMRAEQAFGYDLQSTTNAMRLQANVILRLARAAHARDPLGPPFVISYDTYQAAFVDVTGVAPEALPIFIRMASRYGENLLIEHRRAHVIDSVVEGPAPLMVVRVRGGWAGGGPASYSFEDSSSTPTMRVIHDRDTRFTIADYGDMVTHEEIHGLRGRATSGVLGALMAAIGDARATRSRFAVADDGTQVLRGTVTKWVSFTRTLRVTPDGRAEQGIPDGRADLARIESRLKQQLTVRYAVDRAEVVMPPWERP